MSQALSKRPGVIVLLVGALIGLVAALYGYFAPLTGVNGTLGALLVIIVSLVIGLLAFALWRTSGRGGRIAWRVVILVALAGNTFAGLLLHEWWLCLGMLVGLLGLVVDCFVPARSKKGV